MCDGVASDVHQRATTTFGNVADVLRVTVEVAEEAQDRTQFADPAGATSSRVRSHCGWVRTMKASPILTPVRSRTASSFLASATVRLIGFSHSTCLPLPQP